MSGVELALAIAPLVLTAVKAYQKPWEYTKSAARPAVVREAQVEFCRNLHYEVSFLTLLLQQLVSELPTLDKQEKDSLLAHNRDLWKSQKVSTALEQRLRGENDAFTETLEAMLDAFERVIRDKSLPLKDANSGQSATIHRKLSTLRSVKVPAEGDSILKRWSFTSNEKTRLSSLRKMTNCNKKMQRLLEQSMKTSPDLKKERRSGIPKYGEHRELISDLHVAMAQTCTCDKTHPHEARVCLVRVLPEKKRDVRHSEPSEVELDMLISTQPIGRRVGWQESHVRIVAEQTSSKVTLSVVDERPSSTRTGADRRSEVTSLCSLIEQHGSPITSINFDFEAGKLLQSRPRRRSLNQIFETEVGISLSKLLTEKTWTLTLKERRILAVTLAHTMLKFSEGPWLREFWNKTHIFFFGSDHDAGQLDYSRPYLSTNFGVALPEAGTDDEPLPLHQNLSLLSLGILLLELEKCQPIEEHWQDDDLEGNQPNANTNLVAAERLLENSVDNIYENYRAAVEACLSCDFVTTDDVGLEDEDFRRLVYENVVAPLEEELWSAFRITPENLPNGLQLV